MDGDRGDLAESEKKRKRNTDYDYPPRLYVGGKYQKPSSPVLYLDNLISMYPVTRILVALPRSWKNMETHGRLRYNEYDSGVKPKANFVLLLLYVALLCS